MEIVFYDPGVAHINTLIIGKSFPNIQELLLTNYAQVNTSTSSITIDRAFCARTGLAL